jgi:hypothetical protein
MVASEDPTAPCRQARAPWFDERPLIGRSRLWSRLGESNPGPTHYEGAARIPQALYQH